MKKKIKYWSPVIIVIIVFALSGLPAGKNSTYFVYSFLFVAMCLLIYHFQASEINE